MRRIAYSTIPTEKVSVLAILGLALVLRLANLVVGPENRFGDARIYSALAANLVNGKGYTLGGIPNSLRPPLYPFFLALVYALTGENPAIAKGVQAAIGTLHCLVLYWITRRVFDRPTALISLVWAAGYPYLIFWSGTTSTEVPFALLLSIAILMLLRTGVEPKPAYLMLSGLTLGLSAICRSGALVIIPVALLWLYFEMHSKRFGLSAVSRALALLAVASFVTLVPWMARNYAVFGQLIPVSSGAGLNLFLGNNPLTMQYLREGRPSYQMISESEYLPISLRDVDIEAVAYYEKERAFIKAVARYWGDNPRAILALQPLKLLHFLGLPNIQGYPSVLTFIAIISHIPLLVLGTLGIFLSLRYKHVLLLLLVIVSGIVTHTILMPFPRYRLPWVDPYLIMFASFAICRIIQVVPPRWTPSLPKLAGKRL